MRRTRAGWLLRAGLLVLAFSLALLAFRGGVGVSDRAGVEGAPLLTHIYYTLGLFVLGGLDLGLPQGGPTGLRALLWVAYFLAPMITTSAVIEGAIRIIRPEWFSRRSVSNHVVVVGLGQLGMLFLDALRERHPRARILAVDRDVEALHGVVRRLGVLRLAADIRTQACLDELHLDRASAIVLLTNDDLVNLEVAWQVAQTHPDVRVVAHVGDIGLRRLVRSAKGRPTERVRIINSHRVAAKGLHEEHLVEIFEETDPRDVVVLAGFGRFGQTILEYLRRKAHGELQRAILVDLAAKRQARLFSEQVGGFEEWDLVPIDGSLDDPEVWDQVDAATEGFGVEPVYIVGTDDEALNLRVAIARRAIRKNAPIFVRCDHRSAFTAELSGQLRFEVLAVEAMLRRTMSERMDEWIGVPP